MNVGLPEMPQPPMPAQSAAPPARRLQQLRLVNTKFVIGAILVMLAIGGGAVIVSAAGATESVWSLRTALPRGTQLSSDDLVLVDVRLTDSKDKYVQADEDVVGKTLTRDVGQGELLPVAALRKPACGSLVSIPVAPRHLPFTLRRGAHIDVYATPDGGDKSQHKAEQLLSGAVVQYVNQPGGGAASTSGEWAVGVRVSADSAQQVISALRGKVVDIAAVASAGSSNDPCASTSPDEQQLADKPASPARQGD